MSFYPIFPPRQNRIWAHMLILRYWENFCYEAQPLKLANLCPVLTLRVTRSSSALSQTASSLANNIFFHETNRSSKQPQLNKLLCFSKDRTSAQRQTGLWKKYSRKKRRQGVSGKCLIKFHCFFSKTVSQAPNTIAEQKKEECVLQSHPPGHRGFQSFQWELSPRYYFLSREKAKINTNNVDSKIATWLSILYSAYRKSQSHWETLPALNRYLLNQRQAFPQWNKQFREKDEWQKQP